MIIDGDCHISSHRFDQTAITADQLLAQMDAAGVDRAVIFLKPPYERAVEPENRAVFEAVDSHPERFIGLGWANPRLGNRRTRATITRVFEEYGLRGIKFNGAQDNYVIDDETVLPHIELAATYGKPIAFHIGADFFENTHPYRLGGIAARYPEITFLMIHMGGAAVPSLDRAAIETVARHDNIHIIGSAIPATAVLRAIETLGPARVSFGSDTPFRLMHVELAKYRALLRDLDEAAARRVLGGNLLEIFGVES